MHLAQTMIKGTPWEAHFYSSDLSPAAEKMLKEFRDSCDATDDQRKEKAEADWLAHVERSQKFIEMQKRRRIDNVTPIGRGISALIGDGDGKEPA